MKLNDIVKVYLNRWVVMKPQERDERGVVCLWEVLDEAVDLEEAKSLQSDYENMGHLDVVLYDTAELEDGSNASITAHFFRVTFNRNQGN